MVGSSEAFGVTSEAKLEADRFSLYCGTFPDLRVGSGDGAGEAASKQSDSNLLGVLEGSNAC